MKLHKFTIKKISTRLMLLFLASTTIIFSIFAFVITSLFSDKLTAEIDLVASQQMDYASTLLDNSIKEVWNYYFSLTQTAQFQDTISAIVQDPALENSVQLQSALNRPSTIQIKRS